jgi:predicted AlkP superfamily pyrophosphatase or phosphodiesterase
MKKKFLFFVFIDAFGHEIYKKYRFMDPVIKNDKKLKTVFGFSSTCEPSIFSGRYPTEHGHWSSYFYDEKGSPFKAFRFMKHLPNKIFGNWRVRKILEKYIYAKNKYTGYFSTYNVPYDKLGYFDYLEKHDYFVPGGILKTDTILDYCAQKNIPYHCSNWRLSEEENISIARKEIETQQNQFMYLYLPHLDAVLHKYGKFHKNVDKKIRWLEKHINELYELAVEKYEDVDFYVLSDHGMTDTIQDFDLIAAIEELDLTYGKDYIAMYDSTMARFWFLNDRAEKKITEKLNSIHVGKILNQDDLEYLHVNFEDNKFGDIIFLLDPGVLLCPSYMGQNTLKGMHGFHPDDADSYACLLSNKEIEDQTQSIVDVRRIMEKFLENG